MYNEQGQRFNDRQVINQEMFGIYSAMRSGFDVINAKHNQDAFDLYKYSRDSKDELAGEWFPNLTEEQLDEKIIHSAINFWFEDEDAGSGKVWNYFKDI